jgi:hypothetical protein
MQPIQILVINPKGATWPGHESDRHAPGAYQHGPEPYPYATGGLSPPPAADPLIPLLLFCLLCITGGLGVFVVLSAVSIVAAHLAALLCVTLGLGAVLAQALQEVTLWQTH